MILSGRVRVNGTVPEKMPVLVDPTEDVVTLDDEPVRGAEETAETAARELSEQKKVYFLLNKPKGILVTARDPGGRKTVGELMAGVKERVFPVGRLDMDARGALLMTNDGELANRLTHPRYGVEKTYVVEVDGRVGHEDLERIKRGVWLGPRRAGPPAHDGGRAPAAHKTESFRLKLIGRERGRTLLELHLSESKNSDIRRVMARFGHQVRDLSRVAIAEKITLKGLDSGEYRPLSPKEVEWLFHASSPDFHAKEQAATQAWYEQKEMEKERKRLTREAAEAPAKRVAAPVPSKIEPPKSKTPRPRPQHKGKKPFIPPTGRNAGKPIGGNKIGRQQLLQEEMLRDEESSSFEHPLGKEARDED